MESKNESSSFNYIFNLNTNDDNYSPPDQERNSDLSNTLSYKYEGKKSPINQDSIEQVNLKNFNTSFFLPEEINKYLEGEEENPENKINFKNNDINSPIELQKNNDNFKQENDFDFNNNINSENIWINSYNNSNESIQNPRNNNYNMKINNLENKYIMNEGKNYISCNTNINNFFINNNNQSINLQFNNNPLVDNILSYKISNTNNNKLINNDKYLNPFSKNKFENNPNHINKKNKRTKKKIIDEYSIEMFGRIGWICNLCNNFNYDTRKRCNRCHVLKKQKRVKDYLLFEKNKNIGLKQFWHCKYCGNNNYAFRIVGNR